VDDAIAAMVFGMGLPLSFVESPLFLAVLQAAGRHGPGYRPQSRPTLSTTALDKQVLMVEKRLQPVFESVALTGCTITSDGMSDITNRPLINKMMVCAQGAVFLACSDTSGETKTAEFLAADIAPSIRQVGAENVVQVGLQRALQPACAVQHVRWQWWGGGWGGGGGGRHRCWSPPPTPTPTPTHTYHHHHHHHHHHTHTPPAATRRRWSPMARPTAWQRAVR
jgi:hypothetical protein